MGLLVTYWRKATIVLCLIGAFLYFGHFVSDFYPLKHWLFFTFLRCWLGCALFLLASAVSGLFIVDRVLPRPPPLDERLLLSIGTGTLVFFWGMFVGGLLGVLGPVFFFALPLLLLALGAKTAWRLWKRVRPRLARFGVQMFMPRSGVELAAALLLGVSVLAVYLDVITPLNVGADAHWYHLPMAEHYAAAGAIRPSPEGWYFFAFPHLATILYTWAYLAPGQLHDKIALCSHLEFTLLLVTLVGVSVLTRRLLGGRRHPFAAAAFFLFPGIFVYDSSLITQADHVLAFWGCLLGVVLVRLGRDYIWNEAALVGVMLAGALLTRYQSIYYLIPTGLFVAVLAVYRRRWAPGATWLLVS